MTFTIGKGLPIPPPNIAVRPGISSTIRSLKVGESFFIPGKTERKPGAYRCGCGRKFATRRLTESGVFGTRIWRTA